MAADSVHYLVKKTAKRGIFWEISLFGKETVVRSGLIGASGKQFPARRHGNTATARRHVNEQVTKKQQQEYNFHSLVESQASRDTNDPDDEEADVSKEARKADTAGSRRGKRKRPYSNEADETQVKKRSYEDELRHAAIRANQLKHDHPTNDGSDTDDTTSIRSSASGATKKGISPLNRRRSLRLARKNMEVSLSSQKTVEMASLPHLERMETSTRWSQWRAKTALAEQDSLGPSKERGQRCLETMDTTSPEKASPLQPFLTKRHSTTRLLRGQMIKVDLDEPSPASHVGEKRTKWVTRSGRVSNVNPTIHKLGRLEEPDDTLPPSGNSTRLKRQLTRKLEEEESELGAKRKRVVVRRQQSLTAGTGSISRPPKQQWPISLAAPIVWRLPLLGADGEPKHGLAVCVTTQRCLVGDESGRVIELDDTVTPVRHLALPSGVKCVVQDGDFMYTGCNDGRVYDITQGEPRMVYQPQKLGQLFSLDIYQGTLAVSNKRGQVALFNHHGDVVWRKQSDGEFGWFVKVDDTGVYHGHTGGVSKYSLMDGKEIWHRVLPEAVLSGVKWDDCLYISSGPAVVKIDLFTGKILRTFSKGKSSSRIVHSCAVGAGLVYAGGNKIVCYAEDTGDVVYILTPDPLAASIQYFDGRLFCVGNGALSAIDLTEETIQKAMTGVSLEEVEVAAPAPDLEVRTALQRVPTVPLAAEGTEQGVLLEVYKPEPRRSQLRVRTLSEGFYKNWDVQFPAELHKEGSRFLVPELRPCESGHFYRVLGDIKELDPTVETV